jgi:Late competence development protein ComFB
MESCRNLLLDLVVREIETQSKELGGRLQQQSSINEIAIYALNQLQPVYVATEKDWHIQLTLAEKSLRVPIEDAVCYAIENLWINPSRNYVIQPAEQDLPARALLSIEKKLEVENLTWKQLPALLEDVLKRKKRKQGNNLPHLKSLPKLTPEYVSYLLPGKLYCFHALRLPVTRLALQKMNRFPPEILAQTRLEDIVAMALNQLPPMYGSNEAEIVAFRQRAKHELGTKFERVVDLAVQSAKMEFLNHQLPLIYNQIKTERREAMDTLKQFFRNSQVNWRSCPDYVENALAEAEEKN